MLFTVFREVPKPVESVGALCESFDPDTYKPVKSEHWKKALELLAEGKAVSVVVSGHNAIVVRFIKEALGVAQQKPAQHGDLLLYHYEPARNEYNMQILLMGQPDQVPGAEQDQAEKNRDALQKSGKETVK